jgi:hypothetical protein
VHGRSRAQQFEFAACLGRILDEWRIQQPRCRQFFEQDADAACFIELPVGDLWPRRAEEFSDHPLMHVRVLAQINGREVEAEHVDGAANLPQAATGEQGGRVRFERTVDHVEVAREFGGVCICRRCADRMAQGLVQL